MTEPATLLDERRAEVKEALLEHFASDHMSLDEFERRLDATARARTTMELTALLEDLPSLSTGLAALPPLGALRGRGAVQPFEARSHALIHCYYKGRAGKRNWVPARNNWVTTVVGGLTLDFREALMPAGVTRVNVLTLCGGTVIIVPPDLAVELNGVALMGGLSDGTLSGSSPQHGGPRLVVTTLTMMGGTEIRVRQVGESAKDAAVREERESAMARERAEARGLLGPGGKE